MNIRGFHITEKKVATACIIVLLVVSLFAAIKQTNATAEIRELSNDRMTKKESKYTDNKSDSIQDNHIDKNSSVKRENNVIVKNSKNSSDNRVARSSTDSIESQDSGSNNYTYIAQSGDSYTTIVRRAINEHGGSNLNSAQKIAAETKFIELTGQMEVDIAQNVTINNTMLSRAIEFARTISPDEQKVWQVYADSIIW